MSNQAHDTDVSVIEAQAAQWLVRLDQGELSAVEHQQLLDWLNTRAEHRQAFDRAGGTWAAMTALRAFNVAEKTRQLNAAAEKAPPAPAWRFAWPVLAVLVLMLVAWQGYFSGTAGQGDQQFAADYVSAVGEQRHIELPDHSRLSINTGSSVQVRYQPTVRAVELLQGEAFFEVAKQTNRPFEVRTAAGTVRAVGTAFAVRVLDGELRVVVTEGRVVVEPNTASRSGMAAAAASVQTPVSAGQAVTVVAAQVVDSVVDAAAAQRAITWRQGRLEFDGQSLPQVLAEISRYTDVHIEVADAELQQTRIGGEFKVGDVHEILDALHVGYGVNVQWLDEQHVRLTAAR